MCYFLNKYQRVKTAKEDIVVYKTGKIKTKTNGSYVFESDVQKYYYKLNKLQPLIKFKPIVEGYFYEYRLNSEVEKRRIIEKGYYFYVEPIIYDLSPEISMDFGLGKFVVPKGTKYYVSRHEGIAEQIKFIGKMKKLFIELIFIALMISPLKAEIPPWLKTTGIYTAQIALQATGDALNNHGNKTVGHALNAASTGLILASPFIIHYKHNPLKYMSAYVCMRFALFDPIYNTASRLPVGYIGNSSLTDKWWQVVNPPTGFQMFGRTVIFTIGFSILIHY